MKGRNERKKKEREEKKEGRIKGRREKGREKGGREGSRWKEGGGMIQSWRGEVAGGGVEEKLKGMRGGFDPNILYASMTVLYIF